MYDIEWTVGKAVLCLASIILKFTTAQFLTSSLPSQHKYELNGPPTHTCRAHSAANGEQTSPSSPLEDELQSSWGWICIPPAEPEPESCRNPFHAITLDAAECSLWVKLAPLILRTPTPPHRPPSPFHFLFFHFPSEGEFGHKREDMKATSSFQCDTLQIQMKTTERATHDTDTNGPKMDVDDVGDSSAAACDSSQQNWDLVLANQKKNLGFWRKTAATVSKRDSILAAGSERKAAGSAKWSGCLISSSPVGRTRCDWRDTSTPLLHAILRNSSTSKNSAG